jgi:Protein of unknown function (DUF3168)
VSEGLALQKAIVAALKADAAVGGLVGDRIYDHVPPDVPLPYISMGPETIEPDEAACYDGSTHTVQIDAWSQTPGFPEVKRIAKAIRAALAHQPLSLLSDGYRLVDIELQSDFTLRDPDGVTSHAVMTFRAMTEPV